MNKNFAIDLNVDTRGPMTVEAIQALRERTQARQVEQRAKMGCSAAIAKGSTFILTPNLKSL